MWPYMPTITFKAPFTAVLQTNIPEATMRKLTDIAS